MKKIRIVCETESCKNFGKTINTVEVDVPPEELKEKLDLFLENYGTGSEDDADYCNECGELGVAQDPED